MDEMSRKLPTLRIFPSKKSEGRSSSDLPPTNDKVHLDNLPPEVKWTPSKGDSEEKKGICKKGMMKSALLFPSVIPSVEIPFVHPTERDNGPVPVSEYWDGIVWVPSVGYFSTRRKLLCGLQDEEKIISEVANVLKKTESLVSECPEVPFVHPTERDNGPVPVSEDDGSEWAPSEGYFTTRRRLQDKEKIISEVANVVKKIESLVSECPEVPIAPSFENLPRSVRHSILGLPRSIRQFILGCILRFENLPRSIRCIRHFILGVVAFSTFPSVAGASPASAPGLSSSQMSSTYPPLWYAGIGATMVGGACAFTALVAGIYRHFYPRERGDGLRAVLEVLTSPFQERERVEERVLHMNVGNVNVGKDSVGDFSFRSSPGSSPV